MGQTLGGPEHTPHIRQLISTWEKFTRDLRQANIWANGIQDEEGNVLQFHCIHKVPAPLLPALWRIGHNVLVQAKVYAPSGSIVSTHSLTITTFYYVYVCLDRIRESHCALWNRAENETSADSPTDIASLEADFDKECNICCERKPNVVLDCMHSFCNECVTRWYQYSSSGGQTTCPMCRGEVRTEQVADAWLLTDEHGEEVVEFSKESTRFLFDYINRRSDRSSIDYENLE